ncbi:Cro/CI family transcriptional regulator [Pseudomonas alliivorans]|nr:Cro/CI family transcriptional regulator [Pseudomonas alliivorans]MEE4710202.1 Cro/CI family transcriptional regulator [Pseudomonas alliivorans]MEE4725191.1 Cro/CI family transcriptional regulator [Pseudomonas alliivorans]MEE4765948.1 Cro/CI family transcriptional regulator [Pseudomonas alliivorans]
MQRIHLADFCKKYGQTGAAQRLVMTQGALSKALRLDRQIYVTEHEDGSFTAEEVKPFPSQIQAKRSSEAA